MTNINVLDHAETSSRRQQDGPIWDVFATSHWYVNTKLRRRSDVPAGT